MTQEPKMLTSVHTIGIENDTGWKRLKTVIYATVFNSQPGLSPGLVLMGLTRKKNGKKLQQKIF